MACGLRSSHTNDDYLYAMRICKDFAMVGCGTCDVLARDRGSRLPHLVYVARHL